MKGADFDLIVIGAGSAGLGAAQVPAKIGLKVLLIDKSDHQIGGECLNTGCIPSKALIHISRVIYDAKQAKSLGFELTGKTAIKKITHYVTERQSAIRVHENAEWLEKQGIKVVLGTATFNSRDSVKVNDEIYTAKYIIIATGSRPIKLKITGVELVKYLDNESLFNIDDLPEKLLVVGAGPVGIEMGQALQRLGSNVTFVQSGDRILPHDDYAISSILMEQLKKQGMGFIMNSTVTSFPTSKKALIKHENGTISSIALDAVLVAIGRESDPSQLALDKGDIAVENGRIVSDQYLRTSNKRVFVAGDAAGSLKFSHAAEQHVRLLMNNLFSPLRKKLNNDGMSWVTFTDPQVATFGLNEKALQERKLGYKRLELNFATDDRAITDNFQYGKLLLFISKGGLLHKKTILGGSMIAPNAGEMIQELILANNVKLSIKALLNKIYPYPTASRVNQKILSQHFESQLNNTLKKVLRFLYGKFR